MNRTLVETARTLLADAALPNSYWFDAVEYAAYLHNIVPTRSLDEHTTPEEAWSGNKPNVSLTCVFGCKAFVHILDKYQHKPDPKSLVCSFIGYAIAVLMTWSPCDKHGNCTRPWCTDQVGISSSHMT